MPWTPWNFLRRKPAVAPEAVAPETVAVGDPRLAVVPAESSIEEVLAAFRANQAGFAGLIGLQGNGEPTSFGPVLRCTDLISGLFAQLITTPGSLHIMGPDGKHATGPRWEEIIRWLAETPDGGKTPPFPWWQDISTDFCFGNGLAAKTGRRVLVRLRAATAGTVLTKDGDLVYSVQPFDDTVGRGEQWTLPRRSVIHARWAQTSTALSDSRRLFADAPLQVVRQASEDGRRMDAYIRFRFGRGAWKDGVLLALGDDLAAGSGESGAFIEMGKNWGKAGSDKGSPFLWGAPVSGMRLEPTVGEMQTVEMRNQHVRTAGSIFGVPSPYLNEEVSAWGSGIEQLSRIFWRTSAQPKLMALLSPFSARLLPRGYSFGVDEAEYLRGDWEATGKLLTAIYQSASQTQEPPDLTRTERRKLLGAPPDDEPEGEARPPRPAGVAPPPPFMS